jgi:ribonuclease-3
MEEGSLRYIQHVTGHEFSRPELLDMALTHSSYAPDRLLSNERLEFLGDSVLALIICEKLYERFPRHREGELTKMKSSIVSRKVCAKVAKRLDLDKHAKIGRGLTSRKALSGSVAACLLEALVAVLYIDGGLEAARPFVLEHFAEAIEEARHEFGQGNFKSLLQQHAQQQLATTVVYDLLDEKGPDHEKCFECQAIIGGKRFPSAWGATKKEAEQKAAYNALEVLGLLENDCR